MNDDGKRTEVISFKVSERMALDLLRLAAAEDRSMSDFIYGRVRRCLYGDVARLDQQQQVTTGDKVNR